MNLAKKAFRKVKSIFRNPPSNHKDSRVENFLKIINDGYGNQNSALTQRSVNASGEPIPWFTYPSIEYLNQLNFSEKNILEWGLGNSTLYFAKKCKNITSVEHNREWYNLIVGQLPSNATVHLVSEAEYAVYPTLLNKNFDIIIVDGIERFDCLKTALNILSIDGIIIFDNSDRNPDYCEYLRNQNLIQVDFHGFGPIVNFTTTTSVFFSRTANFKPVTKQPLIPIGGGF